MHAPRLRFQSNMQKGMAISVRKSFPCDPAGFVPALQATALGIRNAFVNQPVEESRIRPEFAEALGLGDRRPDLVVRFGRGKEMPRSLRRPVESVLV